MLLCGLPKYDATGAKLTATHSAEHIFILSAGLLANLPHTFFCLDLCTPFCWHALAVPPVCRQLAQPHVKHLPSMSNRADLHDGGSHDRRRSRSPCRGSLVAHPLRIERPWLRELPPAALPPVALPPAALPVLQASKVLAQSNISILRQTVQLLQVSPDLTGRQDGPHLHFILMAAVTKNALHQILREASSSTLAWPSDGAVYGTPVGSREGVQTGAPAPGPVSEMDNRIWEERDAYIARLNSASWGECCCTGCGRLMYFTGVGNDILWDNSWACVRCMRVICKSSSTQVGPREGAQTGAPAPGPAPEMALDTSWEQDDRLREERHARIAWLNSAPSGKCCCEGCRRLFDVLHRRRQ